MSSFSFTFTTPTNPWVVTHELNDSNPFWVTFSESGEAILPESAVATSADVFTFTFDTAVAGGGRILSVIDFVSFAATSFTDLLTVKNFLGITANDGTHDELLARLIAGVSQNMKNYMRREIIETTHTAEIHSGNSGSALNLENFPVIAASGVTLSIDDDPVEGSSFIVDYDAGQVLLKDGLTFTRGVGNVSVDYVAGFTSGVPQDLNLACVKQVSYEFRFRGDKDQIGLKSSSIIGVVSDVFITDEWGPGVIGVLNRYRRSSL